MWYLKKIIPHAVVFFSSLILATILYPNTKLWELEEVSFSQWKMFLPVMFGFSLLLYLIGIVIGWLKIRTLYSNLGDKGRFKKQLIGLGIIVLLLVLLRLFD